MQRIRAFGRVLVALLLVLSGALRDAAPAHAATETVTVRMARVVELNCDEGFGESCPNDYYPKFAIDGQFFDGKDKYCCAHSTDFETNWIYEVDVDVSHISVPIHMELWDQDDLTADDQIDIANGPSSLDLTFNRDTCIFTGGGLTNYQGANVPNLLGTSEGSGNDSARIYFYITTPHCMDVLSNPTSPAGDGDGDGIPQAWETPTYGYADPPLKLGADINKDGIIDLDLSKPPYNASPFTKDLFVEADYMLGDLPQTSTLQDVVTAFANAPVDPYPDPSDSTKTLYHGITLHAMLDDAVPFVSNILFEKNGPCPNSTCPNKLDDFNDIKNGNGSTTPGNCAGYFGTATDRGSQNCQWILQAKRQVFRYMIFADSLGDSPGSSGDSEWDENSPLGSRGGNDFIVTVGSWSNFAKFGGRESVEAATFMHELGHTLGLGHGGGDFTNCKPTYLSVMNYSFQLQDNNLDPARPLDYSSAAKGTALGLTSSTALNEAHLDETKGVSGVPANPSRNTIYGVGGKIKRVLITTSPIDWNGDGKTETDTGAPGSPPADINYIQSIAPANKYGCAATSAGQTLGGFDDWANIQYNPRLNTNYFADGVRQGVPELTEQTALAISARADLKITKTADQTTAVGGDTLTYTVAVTDLGPDTATNIKVTDMLPDSTTDQRSLPDLTNSSTNTITPKFQYLVPCATADGAVLTDSVTVTGTDTDGIADPYTNDNTASATTTIQAPKLSVSKTATATVNAGEAITYTITYSNTGTGGASNVTITDTLPAGVYYSTALDQGTGPKPNSVTLKGDGTRTLVWNVGTVAASTGTGTIVFTARPTLLSLPGMTYTNNVSLSFQNSTGACTFTPVTASASTTITVVPPTKDPLSQGYWKNHPETWTAEILARIQATDQRFDANQDGALSVTEATSAFKDSNEPKMVLSEQLLATYFNLATRRINAGTAISSKMAKSLGLSTVRDAVIYAENTLLLPVNSSTSSQYSNIIGVLSDINTNKIEVY